MRRAGVEAPAALLALFCFRDSDLRAWAGEGTHNTDDNAFIEFALPFDLHTDRTVELHGDLKRGSRGLPGLVAFAPDVPAESRARDWDNWGVALRTARRLGLSREALDEAQRLR
jgi:hypothetical protein